MDIAKQRRVKEKESKHQGVNLIFDFLMLGRVKFSDWLLKKTWRISGNWTDIIYLRWI